jgi:hypothetical protein
MPSRISRVRLPPALRHAGYSATALLPGESRTEFLKLHRDLIKEIHPDGALEDDIVFTIARLIWRKQNLATLRRAEVAREYNEKIIDRWARAVLNFDEDEISEEVGENAEHGEKDEKNSSENMEEGGQHAQYGQEYLNEHDSSDEDGSESDQSIELEEQRRRELGVAYKLVEMGDAVTADRLLRDLEVERRLDSQIDSCLKRLLLVRGLKSISPITPSTPAQSPPTAPRLRLIPEEK